jgi:hydrogenase expression/formation protein HypE
MSEDIDFGAWTCPLPLQDYPRIVIGHGGGGKLSAELVEHLFLPAFQNAALSALGDASVLSLPPGRVAFTTDSFVVRPLFFPGGSIGDLAVNGTVNDLAMSGAQPLYLSAGFIIEEGLPMATLGGVVERMAAAARNAGVQLVTGDTKVVGKGHGDGLYINTAGIGVIPSGVQLGPNLARPGDCVLVSGTIGDHGMAIMSAREGLEFESVIRSDCAALNTLVEAILEFPEEVHVLRDPTRGGVAATLNEIARQSKVGIVLEEGSIPIEPDVQAACEVLGLDPLHVANEGKLIAIVAANAAASILGRMRQHPLGSRTTVIGQVTEGNPGMLAARTSIGGMRIVPLQIGEQLPRIC